MDHASQYLAMYSSWYGGIIKNPEFMMVPIDDHVVHRGDGIFEAIKFSNRNVYALTPHLDRLWRSSEFITMKMPCSKSEMKDIILETIRAAGRDDGLIRLYVTRGPGGFTTNPYDSVGTQLYIVIATLKPLSKEKYQNGLTVKTSNMRVKESFFANLKSCNYLQNVLMKKEAVDWGVDFTVSLDENGNLAEGSTENFFILSSENEILIPKLDRILRGCTMMRVAELAQILVKTGQVKAVRHECFKKKDVLNAREAFMAGTTMDIMPVTKFDDQKIGSGKPGSVYEELHKALLSDIQSGEGMLTPF
jgi:4-amino-4-deoxychorismate lyase